MEAMHKTKYFKSSFSTSGRNYQIDFGHKKVTFSFCQLLALRHVVNQMSAHEHLAALLNTSNSDILTLCNKEHFIILTVPQILDLKELIDLMFGYYEVNQAAAVYSY